jgi:hypothetical protein
MGSFYPWFRLQFEQSYLWNEYELNWNEWNEVISGNGASIFSLLLTANSAENSCEVKMKKRKLKFPFA